MRQFGPATTISPVVVRAGKNPATDNESMSGNRRSLLVLGSSFAIWVIYGVVAGTGHWPLGVLIGLAASVLLLLLEACLRLRIKLLDWTLLGYFLLAAYATFLAPSARFPVYSSVVVWVLYATVTWLSILLGVPFSLQYARESAPPELWHRPEFLRANVIISVVWGIAFATNIVLVILALNPRNKPLLIGVIAPFLIMGATSLFTSLYVGMARQRTQQV